MQISCAHRHNDEFWYMNGHHFKGAHHSLGNMTSSHKGMLKMAPPHRSRAITSNTHLYINRKRNFWILWTYGGEQNVWAEKMHLTLWNMEKIGQFYLNFPQNKKISASQSYHPCKKMSYQTIFTFKSLN